MVRFLSIYLVFGFVFFLSGAGSAHEFGEGPRRDLLETQTEILPQGKVIVGAVERVFTPGGRSPWHTDHGPKVLYVVEGTLAIEGFSGARILTCGPGPTVCLKQPVAESWYFHNIGTSPVKLMIVRMDPAEARTKHEVAGQITAIMDNRLTIVLGDMNGTGLLSPRQEISFTVKVLPTVKVGDDVVTREFAEEQRVTETVVRLQKRW
jgi:mannose-6-phosphate isomerase-like protein (cupin superfamily)